MSIGRAFVVGGDRPSGRHDRRAGRAASLFAAEAHALDADTTRSRVRALPTDFAARAFTLVEVLLVLAFIALFAAVFIPGVNSILDEMNERGPEQLVNEAVLAARTEALESGRGVELRYDAEKRQLVYGAAGTRGDSLPLGVSLELLPMQAGASILLGGELTEAQEPLKRVRFFPDGTCEPFRLRMKSGADAKPRVLVVDPWTCALSPAPTKGGT